jgi:hypothetical protein
MAKKIISKRLQIDKSQATIVGFIAAAVFVAVFSLISSRALFSQSLYQTKVKEKKELARDNNEQNLDTVGDLVQSYQEFVNLSPNMLDGNPEGNGEKDGDNARLVLDALPSKYDFPAMTSSIEKIVKDKKLNLDEITGVDDEVAQNQITDSTIQEMPVQIIVSGSVGNIQRLVSTLERSIRPFAIEKIVLEGGANDMKATIDMKTYYQPEKKLEIKEEEVK